MTVTGKELASAADVLERASDEHRGNDGNELARVVDWLRARARAEARRQPAEMQVPGFPASLRALAHELGVGLFRAKLEVYRRTGIPIGVQRAVCLGDRVDKAHAAALTKWCAAYDSQSRAGAA